MFKTLSSSLKNISILSINFEMNIYLATMKVWIFVSSVGHDTNSFSILLNWEYFELKERTVIIKNKKNFMSAFPYLDEIFEKNPFPIENEKSEWSGPCVDPFDRWPFHENRETVRKVLKSISYKTLSISLTHFFIQKMYKSFKCKKAWIDLYFDLQIFKLKMQYISGYSKHAGWLVDFALETFI